jgi:hypothetical protein
LGAILLADPGVDARQHPAENKKQTERNRRIAEPGARKTGAACELTLALTSRPDRGAHLLCQLTPVGTAA